MDSRFSPLALRAFEAVFRPWMRRRLDAIRFTGLPERLPPRLPLLVVANHVSWWDAFLVREVHRVLRPGAPLFTVMLEPELARRPFFRWMGVTGIAPGAPASVARTLRGLQRAVHAHPGATVLFFPQGRIWPSHRRPLGFERGVEGLARRLAPVTLLPVAIHLEPLTAPAPTAFLSAGAPLLCTTGAPAAEYLERAVEAELDALRAFLAVHGEAAAGAWPGPYGRLPAAEVPAWSPA
jgi:1-acyl-sn-glycerol-3-phosphate acyltransferase